MAMSLVRFIEDAAQRDSEHGTIEKCEDCGVPLQEAIYGYRRVGENAKCSDCYFDEISDLIDQAPIGRPMSRVSAA